MQELLPHALGDPIIVLMHEESTKRYPCNEDETTGETKTARHQ